jgi:hypothetical protein
MPFRIIQSLRGILTEIGSQGATVVQGLAENDLSLKDQVEVGQLLWRITRQARRALEPVKDSLRDEALQRRRGVSGRQFLHGRQSNSRCTVRIPQPRVVLREGVTLQQVRETLGDKFSLLFEESAVPRSTFAEEAGQHPELLQALTVLVDTKSDPPRVTFED